MKGQLKYVYSLADMIEMSGYSIKVVYEKLMGDQIQVAWDRIVWNRLNVLKHTFVMWLGMGLVRMLSALSVVVIMKIINNCFFSVTVVRDALNVANLAQNQQYS